MGSVGSSGVMTVGSAGSCGVDCDDVMPVGSAGSCGVDCNEVMTVGTAGSCGVDCDEVMTAVGSAGSCGVDCGKVTAVRDWLDVSTGDCVLLGMEGDSGRLEAGVTTT